MGAGCMDAPTDGQTGWSWLRVEFAPSVPLLPPWPSPSSCSNHHRTAQALPCPFPILCSHPESTAINLSASAMSKPTAAGGAGVGPSRRTWDVEEYTSKARERDREDKERAQQNEERIRKGEYHESQRKGGGRIAHSSSNNSTRADLAAMYRSPSTGNHRPEAPPPHQQARLAPATHLSPPAARPTPRSGQGRWQDAPRRQFRRLAPWCGVLLRGVQEDVQG